MPFKSVPYLYILCSEILCLAINQTIDIRGIVIDNKEVKISQYADDTVLFTDGSKSSIDNIISVLHAYQNISGLFINYDKSVLFPVGAFVDNRPAHYNDCIFSISLGPVKYLGISFTHHKEDFFRLNFVPKLSRLKSILRLWSTRDLTPLGKITIIKTFALSQFVYLFTVLPTPSNAFINELNKILFDFIWNGKPAKVKRTVLINNICDGGLKMFDVDSFIKSLKCSWVRRFCSNINQDWKLSFNIALRRFGGAFIFKCNMHPRDTSIIKNDFIRHVCEAWFTYIFKVPDNHFENQYLLNNSLVKIAGKPFFNRNLYDSGAYYVGDLFTAAGVPKEYISFITQYHLITLHFYRLQSILVCCLLYHFTGKLIYLIMLITLPFKIRIHRVSLCLLTIDLVVKLCILL